MIERPKITEAAFQRTVIDLAQLRGWRVAHFRTSQNARGDYRTAVAADGKGFPDLVLVRDRLIFAELKTDTGRISLDQFEWLSALRDAAEVIDDAGFPAPGRFEVHLWQPSDWDAIEATLR